MKYNLRSLIILVLLLFSATLFFVSFTNKVNTGTSESTWSVDRPVRITSSTNERKPAVIANSIGYLYFYISLRARQKTNTSGYGNLLILVKNSYNDPVHEALVTSTSQPTGQSSLSELTNSSGYATFNHLIPGSYTIKASKEGFIANSVEVTVEAEKTKTYTITLSSWMFWVIGGLFATIVVVTIVVFIKRKR